MRYVLLFLLLPGLAFAQAPTPTHRCDYDGLWTCLIVGGCGEPAAGDAFILLDLVGSEVGMCLSENSCTWTPATVTYLPEFVFVTYGTHQHWNLQSTHIRLSTDLTEFLTMAFGRTSIGGGHGHCSEV